MHIAYRQSNSKLLATFVAAHITYMAGADVITEDCRNNIETLKSRRQYTIKIKQFFTNVLHLLTIVHKLLFF